MAPRPPEPVPGRPDQPQVRVAGFEGPLALLLKLIEERQLEITEVSLAEVTDQYLAHLEAMEALDLEVTAEFVVTAARLLELKARVLAPVPREEPPPTELEAEEDGEDLVRRLLSYRAFRDAADRLRAMAEAEGLHFTRIPEDLDELGRAADLQGVTVADLLAAFAAVLKDLEERAPAALQVTPEPLSVTERMRELRWRLRRAGGRLRFEELLDAGAGRLELIVTFLAMLELLRRRLLRAVQAAPLAPIELVLVEDGEGEA